MNTFQRRKFLKRTNFLDLTPVRVLGHECRGDGKITLLMPRFKNRYWSRMFQPRSKGEFIRIKLDEFGSPTWLQIDGNSTVSGICNRLKEQFPEALQPLEEVEQRITKFLSMLYLQRYITFREIL